MSRTALPRLSCPLRAKVPTGLVEEVLLGLHSSHPWMLGLGRGLDLPVLGFFVRERAKDKKETDRGTRARTSCSG